MVGHKTSLNINLRRLKSFQASLLTKAVWKISYKKKEWKKQKHREAKQHATKPTMSQWRNQGVNKNYLGNNENRNNHSKPLGCSKSSSRRKVFSRTGLPQETRTNSINLTLYLK